MIRFKMFLVVAMVVLFAASAVAMSSNVDLFQMQWMTKTKFNNAGIVTAEKPSKDWDTQKTEDRNSPYKFVLHRGGANPKCWLRYDENPQYKTAHSYANNLLKPRLEMRGMKVSKILERVIDGRNVAYIAANDVSKGHRYLIGAWRNKVRGINLECDVDDGNFGVYEPQFRNFIDSVRITDEY